MATLWTSVRLAKLRHEAREQGETERLRALLARARRTGVLREPAALVLVWNEGRADEQVRVVPLRFEGDIEALAREVRGRELTEVEPEDTSR